MLVIRFLRKGKTKQPFFKIVVTDKRNAPRGGRFIEEIGFVNPLTKEKKINAERAKHWISVGAKPSDTVFNLLISEKIIEGKKIPLHKKKKGAEQEVAKIPEAPKIQEAEVKPETEQPKEESKSEEKPAEEPKAEIPAQ